MLIGKPIIIKVTLLNTMTYKKLNLLILFLAMTFFAKGQDNIMVNYTMIYKKDSTQQNRTRKDFVLLTSPSSKSSVYLSYDKYKYDSIKVANGADELHPSKNFDFEFMIKKNYNSNSISKFEKQLNQLFVIDLEPEFKWQITEDKKLIDIYSVQKAILNYKGRVWEAWFTNEIPILDGPYIFSGLPGLILEMKDDKDNFLFILTNIKKGYTDSSPIMSLKPIPTTLTQLKKVRLDYYNDPFREMKSGNTNVTWTDENGKKNQPNYRELTKNERDALIKFNNPVELSDAIIYK